MNMNFRTFAVIALATAFCFSPAPAAPDKAPPKFYAFAVEAGVRGVKPRALPEQAAMLRDVGFDGMGDLFWLDDQLEPNLQTLDAAGLQLYLLQAAIDISPKAAAPYDKRLPNAIRKLKGRSVTVVCTIRGLKPGDPAGVEPAVRALRELGDVAAEAGVRVSVYNHVNSWAESVPFIVQVVRKANHPQVGFNFNLYHWLKVDGDKDFRPLLRDNVAKLFGVIICGSQVGASTWVNGLIQPLDKGDFDNRKLLATLDEIGYRGPIGLMCYTIPGDPREHLTRSMNVWRSWFGK